MTLGTLVLLLAEEIIEVDTQTGIEGAVTVAVVTLVLTASWNPHHSWPTLVLNNSAESIRLS